jgi:ABC-type transporter Mla subunit MlaD
MRRGSASIAANPVLIGAATTLVVIVAVFLAYNANSGLPFVPTYELKTRVPNAANLVKGNDVRIGGTRVGAVTDITPVTAQDGAVSAELTLKLETTVNAASRTAPRCRCAMRGPSRSSSTRCSAPSTTRPAPRRRAT